MRRHLRCRRSAPGTPIRAFDGSHMDFPTGHRAQPPIRGVSQERQNYPNHRRDRQLARLAPNGADGHDLQLRQIREAHRQATERLRPGDRRAEWNDALYVLTCLSQYEITDVSEENLKILLYGLFRPALHHDLDTHGDGVLTWQLLSQLAYQLRMLRRRAVIPTLASLATFLVAFVFSVVLSFAEVGESSSVDPLILGLLYSWLPSLVVFAIVDRNPVSGDRAK